MRRYADLNSLMNNLIQALRKKYPDWSDEELEDYIRNVINPLDPTGIEANYTLWIILQLRNNQISLPEDEERVKQLLKYYDLNKKKVSGLPKDIYFVDFNELENMINELKEKGEIREKSLREQYEEIKEGVKEIYNDGTYRILECTTPEAVVRFGRGSKWCTTDIEKAKEYLEYGPIYRIFVDGNPYASLNYVGIIDVMDRDLEYDDDPLLFEILCMLNRGGYSDIPDDYVDDICVELAAYSDDPEVLLELAKDEYWKVREFVSENPNTPLEALKILSEDDDKDVRVYVAQNPNTTIDILEQLMYDEEWEVRWEVARNPNISIDMLRQLANDKNEQVRIQVAANPNTPSDVLRNLANDENEQVKFEVARNFNTPEDVLRELANDEGAYVRAVVVENPNIPVDVLSVLLKDDIIWVRDKAIEQLRERGIEVECSIIILSKLELDVNDVLKCIKENDQKSCDKVFSQIYAYVRGIVYSKFPKYGEDMVSYIVSRVYRLLKRFYNPAKNPNPVIFINKVISDSIHMFLKDQEHYKKELEVGYIPKYIDSFDIKIVIDEIKNKVDYPEVIDMLLEGYTKKEIEEKTGISFYKIDKMLKQLKPVIKRIIWGIL